MRKAAFAALLPATLALASCDHPPDAAAIKTAVSKFLETARTGAHYDVGDITNVKCTPVKEGTGHGCIFDMALTDGDDGKTSTSHEGVTIGDDGTLVESRPRPWAFEQQAAADALAAGPELAGAGYAFDKIEPFCSFLDGADYCSVSLHGQYRGAAFSAKVFGKAALANGHWTVTADPPKLDGTWERDGIKLNFSKWGLVATLNGQDNRFDIKPNGEGSMLLQLPAAQTLGGTILQNAGPIANCGFKLSLIRLNVTSCAYQNLQGAFYKTTDY